MTGGVEAARQAGLKARGILLAATLLVCHACVAPTAKLPAERSSTLLVRIDRPQNHDRIRSQSDQVLVLGMIGLDREPRREPIDLVLLLDVSAATDEPSGLDVDADGERGFHPGRYLRILQPPDYDLHCTDPDDTILAAEITSAERLIEHAGGDAHAHITLLAFSTDAPAEASAQAPRARPSEPLIKLRRRLALLREGTESNPPTVDTALATALASLGPRRGARRLVAVFTAVPAPAPGQSGAPHPRTDGGTPWSTARNTASELRRSGIELHVLGFGPKANTPPTELSEFTRAVGAAYQATETEGDVASIFRGELARFVDRIEIANPETGDQATDVALSGDGSFSGHIALQEGYNRIRVRLETSLNLAREDAVVVDFEREEPTSWGQLVDLERIQARNRELFRLIEREKALRRQRNLPRDMEVQVDQ